MRPRLRHRQLLLLLLLKQRASGLLRHRRKRRRRRRRREVAQVIRRPRLGKARGGRGGGFGRLRRARHEVIKRDAKAPDEVDDAGAVGGGGQQTCCKRLPAGNTSGRAGSAFGRTGGGNGAGAGLKGALEEPQKRVVELSMRRNKAPVHAEHVLAADAPEARALQGGGCRREIVLTTLATAARSVLIFVFVLVLSMALAFTRTSCEPALLPKIATALSVALQDRDLRRAGLYRPRDTFHLDSPPSIRYPTGVTAAAAFTDAFTALARGTVFRYRYRYRRRHRRRCRWHLSFPLLVRFIASVAERLEQEAQGLQKIGRRLLSALPHRLLGLRTTPRQRGRRRHERVCFFSLTEGGAPSLIILKQGRSTGWRRPRIS